MNNTLRLACFFVAAAACWAPTPLPGDDAEAPLYRPYDPQPKHLVRRMGDDRYVHGGRIRRLVAIDDQRMLVGDNYWWSVMNVDTGAILGTIRIDAQATCRGPFLLSSKHVRAGKRLVDEMSVWHVLENRRLGQFQRGTYSQSFDITPDGALIAVANWDWSLELLDSPSGKLLAKKQLQKPPQHQGASPGVHLAPDGKSLVTRETAPKGGYRFQVFSLTKQGFGAKRYEKTFTIHTTAAFSSDAKFLLFVGLSGDVVLAEAASGKELCKVKHGGVSALSAAVDAKGEVLATTGADTFVRIWSARNGALLGEIDARERQTAAEFHGDALVTGGAFSRLRFWDWASGEEFQQSFRQSSFGGFQAVAMSPRGDVAAAASGFGTVSLWNIESGKETGILDDEVPIRGVGFNDVTIGQPYLGFSPDGKLLATGSGRQFNDANVWNMTALQRLEKLRHPWPVTTVAIRGKSVYTGCRDKAIRLWQDGREVLQLEQTGNDKREIRVMAISPDAKRLAAGTSRDQLTIWNLETHKIERRISIDRPAYCIAFAPDNKTLLVRTRGRDPFAQERRDGALILFWDLEKPDKVLKPFRSIALNSAERPRAVAAPAFALSTDGKTIASTANDGSVLLWDYASGKFRQRLRGHRAPVTGVSWSKDSRRLLSSSYDGSLILWDAAAALATE